MTTLAETAGQVFTTGLPVRWGDMDAMGHVNNAAIVTLLEEGRIRFLMSGGQWHDGLATTVILARHEIDYVRPLYYAESALASRLWITRIGNTSFVVAAEIDDAEGHIAVRAQTTLVCLAGDGSGPTPVPEAWRTSMSRYLPTG